MKVQSQPEIVAAAFIVLYMALGSFAYQVLTVTHLYYPTRVDPQKPHANRFLEPCSARKRLRLCPGGWYSDRVLDLHAGAEAPGFGAPRSARRR